MKIGIVGSRTFQKRILVEDYIRELAFQHGEQGGPMYLPTIVSGGAAGVDTWAEAEAKKFGMPTQILPAEWGKHGKAAGMIRNTAIVEASDRIVAFWDGESRGTRDTINKALLMKKDLEVYF